MFEGRLRTLLQRHRWLRAPVVRSFVVLAEMIWLAVFLHRKNGVRRGAVLLAWLGLYVIFDFALSLGVPMLIRDTLLGNVTLAALSLAFGLFALKQGMGGAVWRYHGAEHKAVNAYENGADLRDLGAVAAFSRVHDRCGTNLVVIVYFLLMVGYWPMSGLAGGEVLGMLYTVLVLAVSLEFFRLATSRPRSRVSRVVLAGGRLLQRCMTTREPAREHLELACFALSRVIELERTYMPQHADEV